VFLFPKTALNPAENKPTIEPTKLSSFSSLTVLTPGLFELPEEEEEEGAVEGEEEARDPNKLPILEGVEEGAVEEEGELRDPNRLPTLEVVEEGAVEEDEVVGEEEEEGGEEARDPNILPILEVVEEVEEEEAKEDDPLPVTINATLPPKSS